MVFQFLSQVWKIYISCYFQKQSMQNVSVSLNLNRFTSFVACRFCSSVPDYNVSPSVGSPSSLQPIKAHSSVMLTPY